MSAPNKSEREKCWTARDVLWKCLDENNDDKSKCSAERIPYEQECSKTWVKYFDRRREYLKFKEKMDRGVYEPKDEEKKS